MSINPSDSDRLQGVLTASIQEHWRMLLAEGIILLVLGAIAVIVPPVATLAVDILVGWLFLISGVVGLITTYMMRHAPGFWWSLLSAVIALAAGILLIGWPVSGVLSLTLMLIVFFIIEGIASIMFALEHRRQAPGRWGMLVASGVIDLILAVIILIGLPGTAGWAIGLLVGINMLFGGAALVAIALHARDVDQRSAASTR
jgi:uncharacterized membrane protein HdeD (DUF308 family)